MKISSKHNNIVITLMLVLSVFLISSALFFSKEDNQVQSFEVGKPWLHPRLEANFQFDIEFDEATRKHITDSVEQNFAKIYTFDRKKAEQQQAQQRRDEAEARRDAAERERNQANNRRDQANNEKNAAELLAKPNVDGGLIGGASLVPEKFAAIVEAAQ